MVALAVLLMGAACTRSTTSSGGGGTPDQIYAAGPTAQDVRSALGSDTWWPVTPSFHIRPLDLPNMPPGESFGITQHFVHVGSAEQLVIEYIVWAQTTYATDYYGLVQGSQTTQTGPKVGDQNAYWGSHSPTDTSLFDNYALVRQGPVLIQILLSRGSGYVDTTTMGRLATRIDTRLKSALKGTVRPSPLPSTDAGLLLPLGGEVTLAGAVRLPIEAGAELLGAAAPQDVVDSFTKLGVNDFLYGDYALNADLNMEVRAIVFTFSNSDDAGSWIDLAIGKSNLDASGVAAGFSPSVGEYYAFILSGSHVGMLFCNSLDVYQAASRACEVPMANLIGAWQTRLG